MMSLTCTRSDGSQSAEQRREIALSSSVQRERIKWVAPAYVSAFRDCFIIEIDGLPRVLPGWSPSRGSRAPATAR
jgi:hypothetical protein